MYVTDRPRLRIVREIQKQKVGTNCGLLSERIAGRIADLATVWL